MLANRAAEIETAPTSPETLKTSKIDTGYGMVELTQKVTPAKLEEDAGELTGLSTVVLTAQWTRGRTTQSRSIDFYVYRGG